MISAVAFLLLTYLVAGVPVGLFVTTVLGDGPDLRLAGSHNLGATNVLRLYGGRLGALVLGYDMAKGLVPVTLAGIGWPAGGTPWLGLVALTAFLGHCYPVYLGFHGGKGVATGAGGMVALAPLPTAAAAVAWAALLLVSRRSSVASLGATIALVLAMSGMQPDALPIGVLIGVGIAVRHLANLERLFAGREAPVVRSVRRGREQDALPDPAAVLASGPAGVGAAAPPRWRTP